MDKPEEASACPICEKQFSCNEIEKHVNKCIFLNSVDGQEESVLKRKRSPSPALPFKNRTVTPSKTKNLKTTRKSIENPVVSSTQQSITLVPSSASNTTKSEATVDLQFTIPLAQQVQPKSLDDFIGQNHVLGSNTVLRALLERGEIPNMILWGPPGCGKTSLSGVIQGMCKKEPDKLKFVSLCAATSGVKDVQNIVSAAKLQQKFKKKTVLFMDEIHRFNKKQQDIFLLHVEKGDIILVGATTENPSFSINSALLSRCRVIVMQKLEPESLHTILERAARTLNVQVLHSGQSQSDVIALDVRALQWLADISDGDARIALGNLQLALQFNADVSKVIILDDVKEKIKVSMR